MLKNFFLPFKIPHPTKTPKKYVSIQFFRKISFCGKQGTKATTKIVIFFHPVNTEKDVSKSFNFHPWKLFFSLFLFGNINQKTHIIHTQQFFPIGKAAKLEIFFP